MFGSTLIMVKKPVNVCSFSCHVLVCLFTLLAVIHIDCHNNNDSVMLRVPLLQSELHAWLISVLCQETFLVVSFEIVIETVFLLRVVCVKGTVVSVVLLQIVSWAGL
jgi:hypothetical protein